MGIKGYNWKMSSMYFITTMVPKKHTQKVIDAMAKAGAGVIGKYTHNAFITSGEGNWYSPKGTKPTVGRPGAMTRAQEQKIEMVCAPEKLKAAINACQKAHPYETPHIHYHLVDIATQKKRYQV
jgi:hypothetical protein